MGGSGSLTTVPFTRWTQTAETICAPGCQVCVVIDATPLSVTEVDPKKSVPTEKSTRPIGVSPDADRVTVCPTWELAGDITTRRAIVPGPVVVPKVAVAVFVVGTPSVNSVKIAEIVTTPSIQISVSIETDDTPDVSRLPSGRPLAAKSTRPRPGVPIAERRTLEPKGPVAGLTATDSESVAKTCRVAI
jgi:hypothetical protein